jgi:hypothetical protein
MCKANDEAKDFLWRFCAERKRVQTLVCNLVLDCFDAGAIVGRASVFLLAHHLR